MVVVPETELAWAAGFFDGEGSTFLNNNRRHPTHSSIQMQVRQVRLEPLEHRRTYGQRYWTWQAASKASCEIAERLWPYLSEPKREQFLAVLAAKRDLAPRDTTGGAATWRRLVAAWL